MGFWIFMLLMDCLIPLTMVFFGRYFRKSGPRTPNFLVGYRTTMSMKNQETWEFAHRYCGVLWWRLGWLLLPLTLLPLLFVIKANEDVIGTVGSIVSVVQLVVLLGSIFPTESALKRNFDQNGQRK